MLAAGQRNSELRVVADQRGCPTSAADLARAILRIAARLLDEGWQDRHAGVYHAAGTGATTWNDLAAATFAAAARHGMSVPVVVPIATHEWPTRVRRPPDSRLDCDKLAAAFGLRLPHWRDGLARAVDAIFASPTLSRP
jgi:dTDP-4-dehydrorhamnose reductase